MPVIAPSRRRTQEPTACRRARARSAPGTERWSSTSNGRCGDSSVSSLSFRRTPCARARA